MECVRLGVSVMQIALANLDTVLLEARGVLEGLGSHLLAEMEDVQKAQFDPASPLPEGLSAANQLLLSQRPSAAALPEGDLHLLVKLHDSAAYPQTASAVSLL